MELKSRTNQPVEGDIKDDEVGGKIYCFNGEKLSDEYTANEESYTDGRTFISLM